MKCGNLFFNHWRIFIQILYKYQFSVSNDIHFVFQYSTLGWCQDCFHVKRRVSFPVVGVNSLRPSDAYMRR